MMLSTESRIAHQAFVALVALSALIFLTAILHQTPSINAAQRHPVPPAEILTSRPAYNFDKTYRHRFSIQRNHLAHQRFHAARSISENPTPANDSTFLKLIGHSREHSTPLERNATAGRHPSLGKRAEPDEPVDLAYYICKGERYLANIRAARPDPPRWAFGNLAHNGWTVDDGGPPLPRVLYPGALAAMRAKGVDNGRNVERTANLENSFVNSRQEVKNPLGGEYQSLYNPPSAFLLAHYSESPTAHARDALSNPQLSGPALSAVIPPLHTWADVTWAVWAATAAAQNVDAGALRYVLRYNIFTAATQRVMEAVVGVVEAGRGGRRVLRVPWPGREYALESAEGKALLGTSHGAGVAWLSVVGRKALGRREGGRVTLFTGRRAEAAGEGDEGGEFYYLLFDLGRKVG